MSPRASLGLGHVEDPGVLSKPPCEMALSLEAALYPSQVVESGAAIEYMSRLLTEEGACGLWWICIALLVSKPQKAAGESIAAEVDRSNNSQEATTATLSSVLPQRKDLMPPTPPAAGAISCSLSL